MNKNKPNATNWLRISSESQSHLVSFASRDWKVIGGPSVPSGQEWLKVFGFYGDPDKPIRVAEGLVIGFEMTGSRTAMLSASRTLLTDVVTSEELLSYNYVVTLQPGLCGVPKSGFSGGIAGDVVNISGRSYHLCIRPGHCYLDARIIDGSKPYSIDLRRERTFVDDNLRTLTIVRRKQGLAWPIVLPPLIEFLTDLQEPALGIYNHHQ